LQLLFLGGGTLSGLQFEVAGRLTAFFWITTGELQGDIILLVFKFAGDETLGLR